MKRAIVKPCAQETPDSFLTKVLLAKAVPNTQHAAMMIDSRVAFMDGLSNEGIIMIPPQGIKTYQYWRLKAASGTTTHPTNGKSVQQLVEQ